MIISMINSTLFPVHRFLFKIKKIFYYKMTSRKKTLKNIVNNFNNYFPSTFIRIEGFNIEITNDTLCISFLIDKKSNVIINELKKCKLSGKESLYNLELILINSNIKYIYLDDQSSFKFDEYNIDLGTLCILAKGESWYNSLGYYQEKFNEEKIEWNIIRDQTVLYTLENLKVSYEFYKTKNKGWFDDGIYIFAEYNDSELQEDNFDYFLNMSKEHVSAIFDTRVKVYQYASEFYLKNKRGQIDNYFDHLLILSLLSLSINYTRYPLYKKLSP